MRLAFAMLAEAATVADGKLYVHGGGWSRLVVDAVPTTHPSFSLVFVLELDGAEALGSTSLDFDLAIAGTPVASVRGWIDVPAASAAGTAPALVTNQLTFTNVPLLFGFHSFHEIHELREVIFSSSPARIVAVNNFFQPLCKTLAGDVSIQQLLQLGFYECA